MKFSNLVVNKSLITNIAHMHNFIVKFGKILDIFKEFAGNRVTPLGNIPRRAQIAGLSVLQYLNYINHRKIGQVKYSLI